MCGIAGYINFKKETISNVVLKNMVKTLSHRGPNDNGIYNDGFCGLAHTRLSIIDLSNLAHQPMITEDKKYCLVYKGEIFNFVEIQKELKSLGWKFNSKSDTEVVLKSHVQWVEKAVEKFNGQFAFAFWNKQDGSILLARDRYGIKPLYYMELSNNYIFSSEIKGILCHPEVRLDLNKSGLIEYMTFQNFITDETLFKNIKIINPGSILEIKKNGISKKQYWDFNFSEVKKSSDLNIEDYKEKLNFLLDQAVNRQLVSDVEIGSYLSGGMDSGTISAIASKKINNMKTFTCGFDIRSVSGLEIGMDERETAEYLSYLYKTEHYQVVLKAGDMEKILKKLTWHLEEPRVGQSYPNFYVSQLASKFCKVVLSGAGGDELFAGYPWRYYKAVNNVNFDDYIKKYYLFWQRMIPNEHYDKLFKPLKKEKSNISTQDFFRNVFKVKKNNLNPEDYINSSLYFEAKTFLHGLLIVEDKLSMANSLETRVPFLDNDLVDFATKIPVGMKLGNLSKIVNLDENESGSKTEKYFNKTKDGKLILRNVMENYVPKSISQGIKKGFSAPDSSWFRGESINFVNKKIMNNNARIFDYLDRETIHSLVGDHIRGKNNRRLLIWSLLSLETWLEITDDNKWKIN